MALEITMVHDADKIPDGTIVADRRLWLTADRARVVEDGDPEARFLFCGPGRRISPADAEKYGLVAIAPKERSKPADKMQEIVANKAVAIEGHEDVTPKSRGRKHG